MSKSKFYEISQKVHKKVAKEGPTGLRGRSSVARLPCEQMACLGLRSVLLKKIVKYHQNTVIYNNLKNRRNKKIAGEFDANTTKLWKKHPKNKATWGSTGDICGG